jgi:hypothetical protein
MYIKRNSATFNTHPKVPRWHPVLEPDLPTNVLLPNVLLCNVLPSNLLLPKRST